MSKTVLTEVRGWTPLIDALVQKHGVHAAAVFGRMWRYCQLEDGICRASLETIADELHLSRPTVTQHIETLIKNGYLVDRTPGRRNAPHIYADTGKAQILSQFAAVIREQETEKAAEQPTEVERNFTPPPIEVSKNFTPEVPEGVKKFDTGVKNLDTRCKETLQPGVKNLYMKRVFKRVFKIQLKDTSEAAELGPDELIPGTDKTPDRALKMIIGQMKAEMQITAKQAFENNIRDLQAFGFNNSTNEFLIMAASEISALWNDSRTRSTVTRQLTGVLNRQVEAVFGIATGE